MKYVLKILCITTLTVVLATQIVMADTGKGHPTKIDYASRADVAFFIAENYEFEAVRPEVEISDIQDSFAKDSILELYTAGIFNLIPEGDGTLSFKPAEYMTRAEFAVVTVRVAEALGIDLTQFDTLGADSYRVFPIWYMNILTNMGIYKASKSGDTFPDSILTNNYLTQKYVKTLERAK